MTTLITATTATALDDYLTIVPRGLQDVVQSLLSQQIRENSEDNRDVVVVEMELLGQDPTLYDAAHLQELQTRLTTAMLKKQQKRQRLNTQAQDKNTTPALTRLPYGNVHDARTQRHVGLGYDSHSHDSKVSDNNNGTSQPFLVWSLPGSNTGTVWLRFSTNATPTAVAACRCIGPLLALVRAYPASSRSNSSQQEQQQQEPPPMENVLQDLQDAMSQTDMPTKWNQALSLWQRHVRPQDDDFDRIMKNLTYRCSCVRDDSKKYTYPRHELLQHASKYLVPQPMATDNAWQVNLKEFQVEFVWLTRPHASVVAIDLRNYASVGAISFDQGHALPPDISPPYLQGDLLKDTIRLRPTTAQLLLHMACLQQGDVVVDPCVGMGTIVMECLHLRHPSYLTAMGGDLELKDSLRARAVEYEKQTRQWLAACARPCRNEAFLCAWDATTLPLATASVDAIVSDLPFGRSCLSANLLTSLVPLLLTEWARILRPSTGRMVLLCGNPQVLLDALYAANQKVAALQEDTDSCFLSNNNNHDGHVWELPVPTCRPINIGGHLVWILRVKRGTRPRLDRDNEEALVSLRKYHVTRDRRRKAPQR